LPHESSTRASWPKGKYKKVAIVAVMHKLLRRISAVVERGTPYVRD
jgi:hypothetical protein